MTRLAISIFFLALTLTGLTARAESLRLPIYQATFFAPFEFYAGAQVVAEKKSGTAGVSFAFRRDHFFFDRPEAYPGHMPSYRYEEVQVPEFSYDTNSKTVSFRDAKGTSTICAVQKGKFLNKRLELTPNCRLEEKLTRLDNEGSPFANGKWQVNVDLVVEP